MTSARARASVSDVTTAPRDLIRPVEAVGIPGNGVDIRQPVEPQCESQQDIDVAPALPAAAQDSPIRCNLHVVIGSTSTGGDTALRPENWTV